MKRKLALLAALGWLAWGLEAQKASPPAIPHKEPSSAPKTAATTATLQIVGEPGVQVFLDDEAKGATTKAEGGLIIRDLAAGNHTLLVVKPGLVPKTQSVSLKAGEIKIWKLPKFNSPPPVQENQPPAKENQPSVQVSQPVAQAGQTPVPAGPPTTPANPPLIQAGSSAAQTPAAAAEGKTSLAIYPIKPAGADASLAAAMTALLASQLTNSAKLRVIDEGMLKEVMDRQNLNASSACDDDSCQVGIGKLVSAQKLVIGNLSKFGSKYILALKVVDILTGASEFDTEVKSTCTEDQLDQLVAVAAAKIRNNFGEGIPVPPLPDETPQPQTPVQSPYASSPEKVSVAIYPIKSVGADSAIAGAMTALLTSRLAASPKLNVIDEATLKTVMEQVGDACDKTSCQVDQVEIGKLLKAQKIITGELAKIGSKYILSLKVVDIQTGAVEFTAQDQCECPEDQLDQLVTSAAGRMRTYFGG